jgi:hypothetical protein
MSDVVGDPHLCRYLINDVGAYFGISASLITTINIPCGEFHVALLGINDVAD